MEISLKIKNSGVILSTSDIFKDPPRIGTIKPAGGIGNLVVRVGELGNKEINIKNCGRVKLSNDEIEKYKLLKGDIILARAIGSEKQLGKASFFDGFEEDIVIDSHVMRFRINSDLCLPIWFYYLITSPHGKFLIQNSGGQTSVQFNINSRQISSIKIPLPPIKIQTEFINLVNKIEKQQQKYYKKLNNLNELKNSLFEELLRT